MNILIVEEFKNKYPLNSDIKVSVNTYGVKFYLWCNLWYTALDLVKLYIDEIHMECLINRVPSQSVHPKLRMTSSMYHKKIKFHQTSKNKNAQIEMKSILNQSAHLNEELIDNFDMSCI